MLKPAILYKEEIERKFAEYLYTDDYFWYAGYGLCNELPTIKTQDNYFQWAIVSGNEIIGYFAYQIQPETDTVLNFGLFSFERGSLCVGKDTYIKMNELIKEHRRVEWRMVGDNPVKNSYDELCKKYNGNVVQLHKVTKDIHGNWYDEFIYEIVKEDRDVPCR